MKTKISIVVFALAMISANLLNAQCKEWIWGDDKEATERQYAFHNDMVKAKQYDKAVAPHKWLLENTPDLQRAIYINGEKIFSNLADDATDDARKEVYVDSLMIIYDMRMEYCGEEGSVMDRKALYAFKYWATNKEKSEWILSLYDKAFELNNGDVMDANLKYYMTVLKVNKFYHNNLSDEEILDRYDKIITAIAAKVKAGGDKKKLASIENDVTEILTELVELNCEKVKATLGPRFEANPNDLGTAEKIFAWMLRGKCTDDPLWLSAAKTIAQQNPSFALWKNIGLKEKANGNTDIARKSFNDALALAGTPEEKAEMEIQLGHLDREAGSKENAREHYRNAAANGDREGYSYIGTMYMQSFEQCAGRENIVDDRAVFLAAYKMFQLAGNASQMAKAKEQFPSVSEIFTLNMKKGQTIRVGCWINESVSLDTRD